MNSSDIKRLFQSAQGFLELGMLTEAHDALDRLPSEFKTTQEVVTLHMQILVKAGEFRKASFLAETLWTWDQNNLDRLVMVALLLKEAGEFTTALERLKKMQDQALQQKHSEFFYLRAQCYAVFNDFAEARNSLMQANEINEDLKMRALEDPLFDSIYGADPDFEDANRV